MRQPCDYGVDGVQLLGTSVTSPQSPASYAYDAQGRITSDTPGTGSAASYSFDASSNLTTLPTGATGTYDHAGELTSSALSGTTVNYTYNADGQRLTATQSSTTLASATWNGAAEPTAYSNSAATGGLTSTTPFGFAGGYTDADGLIYLQARYYDPSAGQFVSVDPVVSQTVQPYEYASGNPVSNTDPTGLLTRSCGVSTGWYGFNFHCAFYFTKSQTRTYQTDVNNLGGGTAAAVADAAVCGFLPIQPKWYAAVCVLIAWLYEAWTIHDIDVAVQNKGCLDFSATLRIIFGVLSGDVHPNWVGPGDGYCKS
jgi:RHS repeat-associated protein